MSSQNLLGHALAGVISRLQVLLPMLGAIHALGLLGESCQFEVIVILYLIGIVGVETFWFTQGRFYDYFSDSFDRIYENALPYE